MIQGVGEKTTRCALVAPIFASALAMRRVRRAPAGSIAFSFGVRIRRSSGTWAGRVAARGRGTADRPLAFDLGREDATG